MFTINCKGKLLDISKPAVMGIINITPDSFYVGHGDQSLEMIVALAGKMLEEGAAILDIGGQTTKPGSKRLSAAEEITRVIPVIETIIKAYPGVILSIDTYQSDVAAAAVKAGASIVNDVSAGSMDPLMMAVVATLNVPYIAMHMQGSPETMQKDPVYENVTKEVLDFFIAKTDACKSAGIKDIIIDPGFGFGKTTQHNFKLLKELSVFNMLEKPVLAGLSRKGMIYRTLGITAADALNGTTALHMLALQNGAKILRVHDVKEAVECVKLFNKVQEV